MFCRPCVQVQLRFSNQIVHSFPLKTLKILSCSSSSSSSSSSTTRSTSNHHMKTMDDDDEVTTTTSSCTPLLTSINDDHGGVIVEINDPIDPRTFTCMLKASLSFWALERKRGVWIKLPIHLVNLVEPTVNQGFRYHHAEPNYLMLTYWIPQSPSSTLPANASHRVGVGAFLLNHNGEVLVVQENSGKFGGSGVWKFPTGVVDQGEDICAAAVREVKEETGIDAEFVEVLAFRQSHQSYFEKSDLFFLCMLRPLTFNIQKQDSEIEAAEWMSFEEYAAQPFVQKHGLFRNIIEICIAKRDGKYSGFTPVPTSSSFSSQNSYYLYCNK